MKKPLLFIAIIACIMVGCKPDESGFNRNSINNGSADDASRSIVGMWFLKTETSVGTALGMPVDETGPGTAKDYYLFKADNTVDVSTADDGIVSGTYTYDPATKKIAMTKDGETSVFTINKLTSDTMVLFIAVSVPELGTALNITATYTH